MKTVFVNGTFDILHAGHIQLLKFAKSLGDHLIVAIDTDNRVKLLKGNSRPINNQFDRKYLLENIRCVDEVKFFSTDKELIDLVDKCDIIVKGSDYLNRNFVEKDYCKNLVYYDRTHHSTTQTIQDIINR